MGSALAGGVAALILRPFAERRSPNAMTLGLFRSPPFTVATALTLLLYAPLALLTLLVPMDLIQVQRYSATAAGAALLPSPVIMIGLSRWSGGS